MDTPNSTTNEAARKSGKHLTLDERGIIQALRREGKSLRAIAEVIGCVHTTVMYELRRGTPARTHAKGRAPVYAAKRGQKAYETHRANSRKPCKIMNGHCDPFIRWTIDQVRKEHWSLDACAGYAKAKELYSPQDMVCTKTLYNMIHSQQLPISLFELPQVLSRKQHRQWNRKNKRMMGRSIEERPQEIAERKDIGHWEADTVVGKRNGKEAVVFTLVERVTRNYIAVKISGRNRCGTAEAIEQLHEVYGDKFSQVFKTITADNGPEFEDLSSVEEWGTDVYFTHPYSSWERGSNERHNGMLREFIPKGASIENYDAGDILHFADTMNHCPRRILGYQTSQELFDDFLDKVYAN